MLSDWMELLKSIESFDSTNHPPSADDFLDC